jgi:hypothetical protein
VVGGTDDHTFSNTSDDCTISASMLSGKLSTDKYIQLVSNSNHMTFIAGLMCPRMDLGIGCILKREAWGVVYTMLMMGILR